MFDSLSERLDGIFKKLKGKGRLDEKNIQEGLREVRLALLEADVNYKVVKEFIERVRQRALGQEVLSSLTPGQQIVKIVHEELIDLLGGSFEPLNLTGSPTVIMLVGLQGSGKTTTAAKLALYLKNQRKKVYLVPADVYRPAAIEQLMKLSKEVDVLCFESSSDMDPVDIARSAVADARANLLDVVIIDTAGRLHIDEELMEELVRIKSEVSPQEILLVADAMTGQDAVNIAQSFNDRLDITGVVLTKLEGDARGGAALSIKSIINKPIKFVGVGEKLKDLEVFHPDRVASRILGMGDILTLIEKAEAAFDEEDARDLEEKFLQAKFDLEDFRNQLRKIKKLGSLEGLLKLIPGMGKIRDQLKHAQVPEKELVKVEAIINSMTYEERKNPKIINNSRKERIARGSGTTVADVNHLLKNFQQMQKMVKKLTGKSKKRGMLPGVGGLSPFGSPLAERDVPKSIYTKKRKERKKKKKQRKKSKKKK
jgi:signal recognition particle subunit SRP54